MIRAALMSLALAAGQQAQAGQDRLFPEAAASRLDADIDAAMRDGGLPSVAVGVWIPGRGRYSHVAGVADVASGAARRLDQPFRIGEVTKAFTATAILTLVDHNQLRKTDRLATWFPDFPHAADISVADLLRMRAGLAEPDEAEMFERMYDDPTMEATPVLRRMADAASDATRIREPGQPGAPSSLSFTLLGVILQSAIHEDLGRFMREYFLEPMQLRGTSFPQDATLPGGLHGYGRDPETGLLQDKTLLNPELTDAAGAMISTVGDLESFVVAVCTGQLLKLGSQTTRMAGDLLADGTTVYSDGLEVGGGSCGHSGRVPGFSTDMVYVDKPGAAVVVSVNRLDRDRVSRSAPILKIVVDAVKTQLAAP